MTQRDNGLHATSYVRLRDVETHLVEGLLERLRDEEVAAYVEPAPGKRGPYGDTVLPVSPTDSVYVDTTRLDQARAASDRYLAEIAEEERTWAGLVAAFEAPTSDEVPRWPASEDIDEPDSGSGTEAGGLRSARVVRPADLPPAGFGELRDAITPEAGTSYDAGRDDHFEPPPPPPLPMPDTIGRFAWAAVVVGPLFLVISALFSLDVSGWPGLLALCASVGGFITLVARMKDRPDSELGDDDGAVV
jgi:hypothetical protein